MKLRLLIQSVVLVVLLPLASGCSPSAELIATNDIDPAGQLSRDDYLALRDRPTAKQKANDTVPPIPKMPDDADELSDDGPLSKLVTVTVTDSVPVRDVLLELVRKTGANLELDPRVQGSVIIAAKDQPFEQVLKRICALANLRYTVDGSFIRIEPDTPYQKSYRLDYLSLSRKASSDTSISTNVFDIDVANNGETATRGSSASENNSTAKVTGHSEADLWAETEKTIAQILGSSESKANAKANYSINKQAGIVTVFATQKQHKSVETYLIELRRKASTQVLIDARIIEVELDETFQSGIDWAAAFKNNLSREGVAANFGTETVLGSNGYFTAAVNEGNFRGIINLVQTFGTTRVLSAPRVTVLNNQTAVMKVATNQVYFVTQAQFGTITNANGAAFTTNPIYTSTPRTVPVGLVMTVQPSIDAQNNKVTMTLRPTISRVVGQVEDPSIELNAAIAGVSSGVDSQIPVLAVREMDSVIQLNSGEIAVMGGLMQDSSMNTDEGLPGMADLPFVGNFFKSRDNNGKTSELVILLRATISEQPAPDKADGDLYHVYNRDPRPIKIQRSPPPPLRDADEFDDDPSPSDGDI